MHKAEPPPALAPNAIAPLAPAGQMLSETYKQDRKPTAVSCHFSLSAADVLSKQIKSAMLWPIVLWEFGLTHLLKPFKPVVIGISSGR